MDKKRANPASVLRTMWSWTWKRAPDLSARGGEKLMGAIDAWPDLPIRDAVAIDIGSSTGGFTDCLLQHGAAKVYAVDVGRGQLHWDLRNDPRVDVREQTNARYLEADDFDPRPALGVTEVSFISWSVSSPPRIGFSSPART